MGSLTLDSYGAMNLAVPAWVGKHQGHLLWAGWLWRGWCLIVTQPLPQDQSSAGQQVP